MQQTYTQIQIKVSDESRKQAEAAGFASLQEYVEALLNRDVERAAIKEGIRAMEEGRVRPFEEFAQELREQYGIPEQA